MANICKLVIDNRENIKLDIKNKINDATFENLELGDFLFKVNDVDVLIIERKTISDYAASIKDGRNREQKKRLLLNYPLNKILYLIEGDLTTNNPNFGYNQVSKETIADKIKIELEESSLPYRVDVVYFPSLEHPDLADHIRRAGILFYDVNPG